MELEITTVIPKRTVRLSDVDLNKDLKSILDELCTSSEEFCINEDEQVIILASGTKILPYNEDLSRIKPSELKQQSGANSDVIKIIIAPVLEGG
ncbi:MAG: hypothetical protein QW705_02620 [Zestosphaera sp.]